MQVRPLFVFLLIAACAPAPYLPDTRTDADRNAPYPTLVPLAPVVAQATALGGTANPDDTIGGRVADLNARADALRGPLIDPATAERMDAGVDSTALQ